MQKLTSVNLIIIMIIITVAVSIMIFIIDTITISIVTYDSQYMNQGFTANKQSFMTTHHQKSSYHFI